MWLFLSNKFTLFAHELFFYTYSFKMELIRTEIILQNSGAEPTQK
jgi:hypothetical protein